jgi:hypothetical protein
MAPPCKVIKVNWDMAIGKSQKMMGVGVHPCVPLRTL